jgi:hypothetical protein
MRKFAVGRTMENYLSIQVRCGGILLYTMRLSGHRDYFTHCDGALLENKSSFVLGDPDRSSISSSEGTVPPEPLRTHAPKYAL